MALGSRQDYAHGVDDTNHRLRSEQRFLPLAFHIFYVFSMRNYFPFYQKTKMADDRRILQELGSTEMSCTALSANVPAGVQGG